GGRRSPGCSRLTYRLSDLLGLGVMTSETETRRIVESIPAAVLHEAISALDVSHVLIVPDTHQKSLLASLARDPNLKMLTFSTEDEAICVNAGLWIGGAEAVVIIQNVGLFAGMNALRGVAMDMNVPTLLIVGQYGRDVSKTVEDNSATGVRLIEPVLDAMGVPHYRLDFAADIGVLRTAYDRSRAERRPVVVLIGAPTS
ncbi:MAG TPA: thiamine pyrophosphate-binding protein, partial [Dehalococcoidia bacterium]|nr:thiamine pyrophosphate-binding protein [Dehalococcoidia bacterium]